MLHSLLQPYASYASHLWPHHLWPRASRYASYASRLVGVPPWTREARASLTTAVAATLRCMPERAHVTSHELRDVLMRHQCNLYGVTGRAGSPARSEHPGSRRPMWPMLPPSAVAGQPQALGHGPPSGPWASLGAMGLPRGPRGESLRCVGAAVAALCYATRPEPLMPPSY